MGPRTQGTKQISDWHISVLLEYRQAGDTDRLWQRHDLYVIYVTLETNLNKYLFYPEMFDIRTLISCSLNVTMQSVGLLPSLRQEMLFASDLKYPLPAPALHSSNCSASRKGREK